MNGSRIVWIIGVVVFALGMCFGPRATLAGPVGPACAHPVFGTLQTFLTSINQNSRYVRFGDLDGDGDLDAVSGQQGVFDFVCDCYPGEISVLFNDGNGLFSAAVPYEETDLLNGVELGDFDGDEDLDVVVGNTRDDLIWVYLNDGSGGLSLEGSYPLSRPSGFSVDDLDGDGDLDLLVRYSPFVAGAPPRFRVYANNGSGAFTPGFDFENELGGVSVLGDLNGDGELDAVVNASGSGTIGVFFGQGDGTFANGPTTPVTPYPKGVALGDLDGDQILDAAVVSLESSTASILIGRGDGTFAPEVVYAVGDLPLSVAVGDVDGDGDLDVVTGDSSLGLPGFDASLSVLLNDGSGVFAPAVQHGAGPQPASIQLADLDGDGDLDAGFSRREGFGFVDTVTNNGDGTFGPKGPVQAGVGVTEVLVGQLDGQGPPEWVVLNGSDGDASVFANNGEGDPQGRVDYPVSGTNGPRGAALADVDGNGTLDLVVADFIDSEVVLLEGLGDASFGPPVGYPAGFRPYGLVAADFDGDGWVDFATANRESDDVTVLRNLGDGTLGAPVAWSVGAGPEELAGGDLDGDGAPELVAANVDFGFGDTVSVLRNAGDGTFLPQAVLPVGEGPRGIALGDPDGDGDLDLAVASAGAGSVSLFLNAGDGTLGSPMTIGGLSGAAKAAWADVNGDGIEDLLVAAGESSGINDLAVLFSRGDGTLEAPFFYPPDWEPGPFAIADVTGDRVADVSTVTTIDSLSILVSGCPVSALFSDGFESGDTSAWSSTWP